MESDSGFALADSGAFYTYDVPLEKGLVNDREYRIIRLRNKLEVALIRDATTDKACAAMDVHVGSFADPADIPGLAHFCEHLLFMGTEKYPNENEYEKYIKDHNGEDNAFTQMEHTSYYFSVKHDALKGALDRFAQFFICPLFSESCADREMNAVHSEHSSYLQEDDWRVTQVEQSLANPQHPYSRFSTGNLETLKHVPAEKGISVRQALLDFHEKYYSANIMKLAVLGREDLDTLCRWVVEMFSSVKNNNVPVPEYVSNPYTEKELMRKIMIVPVGDRRELQVCFPLPDDRLYYEEKPLEYICRLIGHQRKGSLLSLLKKQSWANDVMVRKCSMGKGTKALSVFFDLTKDGVENHEAIIRHLFECLERLKQDGIKEEYFAELAKIQEIHFTYGEKDKPTCHTISLAAALHRPYPRHRLLSACYTLRRYNPARISEFLEKLAPDNSFVTVLAREFKPVCKSVEKWYKTQYCAEHYTQSFVDELNPVSPNPAITLPDTNRFLPENFDVERHAVDEPRLGPDVVANGKRYRVWHKKDDQFWLPRAHCKFLIRCGHRDSPLAVLRNRLFAEMVEDSLVEYGYEAAEAGIGYCFSWESTGVSISIEGFNNKLGVLLRGILERLKSFRPEVDRFSSLVEYVEQDYSGELVKEPFAQAFRWLKTALCRAAWPMETLLETLKDLKMSDIEDCYKTLKEQYHVEALLCGNVSSAEALELTQVTADALSGSCLPRSSLVPPERYLIPAGTSAIYRREVWDPENMNSAVVYYCEVNMRHDSEARATCILLEQLLSEPFFDQLRTKEQLGYLVRASIHHVGAIGGFQFAIQSEEDPLFLELRISSFLKEYGKALESLTDEEFETNVAACAAALREKYKTLRDEFYDYWLRIVTGIHNFQAKKIDLESLKKITKQKVIAFYKTYLHPDSTTRCKLSIHFHSQKKPANRKEVSEKLADPIFTDLDELRRNWKLAPYPDPLMKLNEQIGD